MDIFNILAFLAAGATVTFIVCYITGIFDKVQGSWKFPATILVLFLAWSLYSVIAGGATGFWTEHTRHAWGNQIWFDLLLAAAIALVYLIGEARKLGMNLIFWVFLVCVSGSIGLLAMLSRILYLQQNTDKDSVNLSEN